MAEYINFEAEAEDIEQDEVSNLSDNESENSFIDDQDQDTDVNFYTGFTNVENDINQVLQDSYNESLKDIDNFDEISSLCYGSEEESEIDDFKNFKASLQKFEETLFPRVDDEDHKVHDQICYVILYALRFDTDGSKNKRDKKKFQKKFIVILLKIFLINLNLLSILKKLKKCDMKSIVCLQMLKIKIEKIYIYCNRKISS